MGIILQVRQFLRADIYGDNTAGQTISKGRHLWGYYCRSDNFKGKPLMDVRYRIKEGQTVRYCIKGGQVVRNCVTN